MMHNCTTGLILLTLLATMPATAAGLEGRLDWFNRVELSVPVSGVITEVNVESGAHIEKSRVLLKLDQRPFLVDVHAAKVALKSHKLKRDEAERELTRAKELYERTLLSDHDLQLATIGYETAESEYQLAIAALKRAELHLEYSRLRAPFNAIVVERHAVIGQAVAADLQPPVLFILADADRMRVRVGVSEAQLPEYRPGREARISVAGKTFEGRLVFVSLESSEDAAEAGRPGYEAVFEFPTGGAVFHRNQAAEVELQ